jgi:hypothetical protein
MRPKKPYTMSEYSIAQMKTKSDMESNFGEISTGLSKIAFLF